MSTVDVFSDKLQYIAFHLKPTCKSCRKGVNKINLRQDQTSSPKKFKKKKLISPKPGQIRQDSSNKPQQISFCVQSYHKLNLVHSVTCNGTLLNTVQFIIFTGKLMVFSFSAVPFYSPESDN